MTSPSCPQTNLLAVTGRLADPGGNLVSSPRGALDLSWLVFVSAETARRGRERLAQGQVCLDRVTLSGWFCHSEGSDLVALEQLEQRAWRKSLAIWKGRDGDRWALHNRATLHRLMYLLPESENRAGHLRKTAELYAQLAVDDAPNYRAWSEWAFAELESGVLQAGKDGNDDAVARALLLISQSQGMLACETLQERLTLEEIDDLALLCATLMRDLLPYQGVAHAPAHKLLAAVEQSLEFEVLPPAHRLALRLVPETLQRRRVDTLVAELCALLAQTLFKAGDGRAGRKWQNEAARWEPQVAKQWEPSLELAGDEQAARVEFSSADADSAEEHGPREFGNRLLGVSAQPAVAFSLEAREEWLEAVRCLGITLFPLRRFSVYRNPDTGELGGYRRLPLKLGHTVWQMVVVVGLSFLLLGAGLRFYANSGPAAAAVAGVAETGDSQQQLERAVERLKRLAEVEAELRRQPQLDKGRLSAIAEERQLLIRKVEQLEKGR